MKTKRWSPARLLINLFGAFLLVLWWLPLVWNLVVSVKPLGAIVYDVRTWLVPPFTLDNFRYVFTNSQSKVLLWLFNSFFVSTVETCGVIFLSLMAAYSFSRFRYRGQKLLFWIVMAGMMVPFQSLLIPMFLLFRQMGLLNTYWSLILPGLGSSLGVILLKQFIDGLPQSLFDAAKIDGCSSGNILLHVVIPLTKPAMASLIIFTFLQKWNDFLWPYISISKAELMTIPIGIVFFRGQYTTDIGYSMAANVAAALPVLILFFCFQKYIVKGIALSGIKE